MCNCFGIPLWLKLKQEKTRMADLRYRSCFQWSNVIEAEPLPTNPELKTLLLFCILETLLYALSMCNHSWVLCRPLSDSRGTGFVDSAVLMLMAMF